MPKIKVNNVALHYEKFGTGKETLVFSHGYLMNSSMFKAQIDALKDKFTCIAFDHRGHGASEVTSDGYDLDNLVTDAISLIEALELGSVHFMGMSTGGFVGMRIALRRPDLLKSLILNDTSAEDEQPKALKRNNILLWVVKYIGFFAAISQVMPIMFYTKFLKDPSRKAEVGRWRNIILNQDRKAMVQFGHGIFARKSVLDELANLRIPTAIIVGDKDKATPIEYSRNMAAVIPNSSLFVIEDAGHSAAIEKPEEVTNAICEFYSGIGLV